MKRNIFEQIKLAQQGDQNAFTFLLNTYWAEVYNFMLKRTGNEVDAEDVTIETFSKAFSNITKYKEEYAFNTWLISIAKNAHIDLRRKRKNFDFVNLEDTNDSIYANIADDTSNVEDAMIKEQNLNVFKAYVKMLKPHYQEVIELRFFQELSYKEIAEVLTEPISNVKTKILRAKKLLTEIVLNQIDKSFII